MNYPLYRRGTFAVLNGGSYPVAYTTGADYVHFTGGPTKPVDLCERVFSVQVYATYRDHTVLVDGLDESGMARVMEAQWDGDWATENGFVHENAYEYFKTVELRTLRDYYEKQSDLLFTRWRSTHFARPIGGHPLREEWTGVSMVGGRPRSDVVTGEDGRVAAVTTRAEYLGHPCEVAGIAADGSVRVHALSLDESRTEANGFVVDEHGRWTKTVHVYDLARYHEHHVDLLFDQWRESSLS